MYRFVTVGRVSSVAMKKLEALHQSVLEDETVEVLAVLSKKSCYSPLREKVSYIYTVLIFNIKKYLIKKIDVIDNESISHQQQDFLHLLGPESIGPDSLQQLDHLSVDQQHLQQLQIVDDIIFFISKRAFIAS